MRKLHVVNDDEGGKSKHEKGGRSTRQADEKVLAAGRVGRREGGRKEAEGLFVPFCRRDELPLTSFSRLVQITTSHSIQSGSPLTARSRLKGAVATFTIPSLFSNATAELAKNAFLARQNIGYIVQYRYRHLQSIDQAAHGS